MSTTTTKIEWCDRTWNCIRGCSRISEGCRNCYAERVAARFSLPVEALPDRVGVQDQPFYGFAEMRDGKARWTGKVELVPDALDAPLRWRKPARIFVNSMSDLFHERLSDEDIAAVFGVMAAAPQHTFLVLTKRAERMRQWFEWAGQSGVECADGTRYEGAVRFNAMKPPSFDVAYRADPNTAIPPGWQYLRVDKGCLPFRKGADHAR